MCISVKHNARCVFLIFFFNLFVLLLYILFFFFFFIQLKLCISFILLIIVPLGLYGNDDSHDYNQTTLYREGWRIGVWEKEKYMYMSVVHFDVPCLTLASAVKSRLGCNCGWRIAIFFARRHHEWLCSIFLFFLLAHSIFI